MSVKYRVIPGYIGYAVSSDGEIKSIERDLILRQYLLNGYRIVDAFRGSLTETLPVHRAVALAWVPNPDPEKFIVVNHRDGNPLNNDHVNLEWTTVSGNNYHAISAGLRSDNIPCKVRDFCTGIVTGFDSIAQASEFMGLGKIGNVEQLSPKKFGALVRNRFEFKFAEDPEPWFYENRPDLIKPSRYMVIVEDESQREEVYSTVELLKRFQLYRCDSKSIPQLAAYGNKIYPDKKFTVRDSYTEARFRTQRATKKSFRMGVRADSAFKTLVFRSLTKCAAHFNVDRSSIMNRLGTEKQLDGWIFTTCLSD